MITTALDKHLINNEKLKKLLSSYQGCPAIFNQMAPIDTDKGWNNGNHYAQAIYNIDTTAEAERKIAGTLGIDVVCSSQSSPPEDITATLKDCINGYFFKSDEGDTISAMWERADAFTTEPDNKVFGNSLSFSLLAFPNQITADPDPVKLMNGWIKEIYPHVTVIGVDETPDVWKPTDENPAVYWKLRTTGQSSSMVSNYHCTWIGCALQLHIIAPSVSVRNTMLQNIVNILTAVQRVIFPQDRSPFHIERLVATAGADPVRTGQLTVTGSYGILRTYQKAEPLNSPTIDY